MTCFTGSRPAPVIFASPGSQPPSGRHSASSSGPAARWIAPSTPPPPSRLSFAALTIASASESVVMSPWWRVIVMTTNVTPCAYAGLGCAHGRRSAASSRPLAARAAGPAGGRPRRHDRRAADRPLGLRLAGLEGVRRRDRRARLLVVDRLGGRLVHRGVGGPGQAAQGAACVPAAA